MKNVAPIQLDQPAKIKVMFLPRSKAKVNTQNINFTISTQTNRVPNTIIKPIKL